ncbi:MAG: hypothetical protein D3924_09230 [Candidatus Electrothrix sp. AR4]|nr:hypothetical protein [Candidatus Electrothrix sp. AR4]
MFNFPLLISFNSSALGFRQTTCPIIYRDHITVKGVENFVKQRRRVTLGHPGIEKYGKRGWSQTYQKKYGTCYDEYGAHAIQTCIADIFLF